MNVKKCATEYLATCDRCGYDDVTHQYTRERAVKDFKDRGWRVTSRSTICPKCREESE